ncbi:MAG: 50S ribosomal protein L3 [Patescibacteria group bacterium]|nr:50S ribosomal protein L3 [Patescibacteria group bacterium]MDE1988547.1 50S ribosomal protein L3 [Patescibacteria group bacterium]MDE2217899.1 50S ribosomal protein L3 [Patescibacteria group bacterium]
MKFILGIKKNMAQVFDDKGNANPVTVLNAGPVVVTQVKSKKSDGYEAVQVGYGEKKPKNISKAVKGHLKDLGNFRYLKEYRIEDEKDAAGVKVGDKFDLSVFNIGDILTVSSVSKGKGFQGVVKRHGFKGGPRSHGQKHSEREPGSISQGLRTSIRSGMRMAGRMGGNRVTVKNLKVTQIDPQNNILLLKGAVPGRRGTVVEIRG